MTSVETYKKSMEIEFFLRRNLNLKPGSRTDRNLKGYYESIVMYEQGKVKIYPSQFKKHFDRLLKHFEKVIDKKTNSTNRMQALQIKSRIPYMEGSEDILYLFGLVKSL